IAAKHMIDGGPSVLFDAVVLLLSEAGAESLGKEAAAKAFVSDAFTHCKFIGYSASARSLLVKAGVAPDADEGIMALDDAKSVTSFVEACKQLRLWTRETDVKQ
ncbi:MAG: catalase HPII, partial [Mesorhizobium sp.]